MVDQRGLEKRNDEAAGDHDVHDDAHVHVPHEHALLCKSSLRFEITLTGFPTGFPVSRRTMRKLHRRDEGFLFCLTPMIHGKW
jgi:alpha-D-ribose 1-methylphosphonate 5-triphosphate synthase subunit PhnI